MQKRVMVRERRMSSSALILLPMSQQLWANDSFITSRKKIYVCVSQGKAVKATNTRDPKKELPFVGCLATNKYL